MILDDFGGLFTVSVELFTDEVGGNTIGVLVSLNDGIT
jgi:hypothetical protein